MAIRKKAGIPTPKVVTQKPIVGIPATPVVTPAFSGKTRDFGLITPPVVVSQGGKGIKGIPAPDVVIRTVPIKSAGIHLTKKCAKK